MSTTSNCRERPQTSAEGVVVQRAAFVPTRWSVVLTAGKSQTATGQDALARLCQLYWYPLYAYVRRRGYVAEDAQDLTQEFFARLLAGKWLGQADPARGRFRSFLLTALNHFLADEWDRATAKKRGGGTTPLPLPLDTAESRYARELTDPADPAQLFERRWAVTLLDEVLQRLRAEYVADQRIATFAALRPALVGENSSLPYIELAAKLGLSESGVKSAVRRLRRRYRQLLLEEISQTVASPGEVEDELRHLFVVLSAT